jgi:peptide/nickel transport system substrate-binding protein
MRKRILALLMAALMVMSIFDGCSNNPTTDPTTDPTTGTNAPAGPAIAQITIGTSSAIETATRDEYAYDMLASGVSELPLVYQDTTGTYHPLLASFKTEDATTWTYTIVEGMKWSDGTKVTAEDILYTLQYGDKNGSANFVEQTDKDGKVTKAKYASYKLSDDKMSISLTLTTANVRELSNMTSFRVMPKHIYEGKETTVTDADKRIGCGPYMFESFNKEAGTISFVVNPHYPKQPNVAKIVYRIFSNEDTMYMALQQGDIDMVWNYSMGVSSTYQSVLDNADSVTLVNIPALNAPAVLAFNNAKGPFTDVNLRKAVAYALDYNAFKIYFGSPYAQTPNGGFVPTTTVGYKETAQLETNLNTAREYLKKAGYTEKNKDGFYVNANGEVLGFSLTVNAGKTTHVGYAELIKTNLEAFGIQVTLDALDGTAYNAKTSNKFSENNITHEAAIFGYTAAGMGMMNGLASIYVDGTHAVQGGCQVYDANFQAIIAKMAAAKTIEEYYAAAGELQDFYAAQTPLVALYWDNMMLAHSSKYTNITVDAVFGLNNVNNWFTITAK